MEAKEVAQILNRILSVLSDTEGSGDIAEIEKKVLESFEDLAMINNLSNLNFAQVKIGEQLNNSFS